MTARDRVFEPSDWHELGAWHAYLLAPEFWLGKRFANEWNSFYGWRPRTLCFYDGEKNHQYLDAATIEKLRAKTAEPEFFPRLLDAFNENKRKILALATTKQNTLDLLRENVYAPYARNAVYDWTAFIYEQLEHDETLAAYEASGGNAAGFAALVTPAIETATLRERKALLESALRVQRGSDALREAQALSREYGFIPVFHMNEPRDAGEYEREIRETAERSAAELESELARVEKTVEDLKREQAALEAKTPAALLEKIRGLRACAEIRAASDELVSAIGLMFREALQPIAGSKRITFTDLFFLKTSELEEADERKIAERREFFAAYSNEEGDLNVETGAAARKLVAALAEKEKPSTATELKGIPASPGTAKGKARIVTNPLHAEIAQGEVLVAPQTTVDYVPLMRKAAAIVTDCGGLTSHAAIIAREFGIPCIVGTKTATTAFKNGDVVEVDASRGIARKIK